MPFVNDTTDLLDIKTIDKERGIVLKDVTSFLSDAMPRYDLEWDNQTIHLTWIINHIHRPKNFKQTEEVLLQIITEALDAYGEFHNRERVKKVTVTFEKDVFTRSAPTHWSDVV